MVSEVPAVIPTAKACKIRVLLVSAKGLGETGAMVLPLVFSYSNMASSANSSRVMGLVISAPFKMSGISPYPAALSNSAIAQLLALL